MSPIRIFRGNKLSRIRPKFLESSYLIKQNFFWRRWRKKISPSSPCTSDLGDVKYIN